MQEREREREREREGERLSHAFKLPEYSVNTRDATKIKFPQLIF